MNQGTATTPAGDGTQPPSSAGRGRLAAVFLRTVGFASVASLLVLALYKAPGLLAESRTDELRILRALAQVFGSNRGLLAFGYPLAAVTFLIWIYQARARQKWFLEHGQAVSLFSSASEISPRRSVYVWFIPLANLVLPYGEVRDLFSSEGTVPGDRQLYLPLWWGTFIASNVAANVSWLLRSRWMISLESAFRLTALSLALLSVAAFLCARLIAEFERRTARRTLPESQ